MNPPTQPTGTGPTVVSRYEPCPAGCGNLTRPGNPLCGACWALAPGLAITQLQAALREYIATLTDTAWNAYETARQALVTTARDTRNQPGGHR